jgi:hypothetical protein
MDFHPVVVKPHPTSSKHSPESRYWRQFKHPVFVKEYAPVTSVHFSPCKPHRFAVTAATRIQIYAPRTQKVTKTISRFKDVARSGSIRADGKLVVAGDDSGLVQVVWFRELSALVFMWTRFSTSIRAPFCALWTPTSSPYTSPNFLPSRRRRSCLAPTIPQPKYGMSPPRPPYQPSPTTPTTFVPVRSLRPTPTWC